MTRLTRNVCLLLLSALAVPLLFQGQDPVRRTSNHWIRDRFLREGRAGACTATLPDGRMLTTGGQGSRGALGTAEYLSVTGDYLSASPMNVARSEQVCAALPDGRVLVAGGRVTGDAATNAAEIYDPSTDLWTNIPAMGEARIGATVTPLVGGTILIAGGEASGLASATLEIFDPNTETFSFAGSVMSSPRKNHAATRLPDGRVLIGGGTDGQTALATVEVFDPASGSIHSLGRMSTPRDGLSATLLDNGQVLLAGGSDGGQDLASSDLFDTRSGSMAAGPAMSSPRRGHQAFLMPHNNTVMIVGGTSAGEPLATTEQFVWWAGAYRGQFKTVDSLSSARSKMTGAASDTGTLTIAGGRTADGALSLVSNTVPVATVTSDKLDYQPGDVVYLSGAGFGPNDVVHVVIHETPTTHADVALDITADAAGAFNHVDVYHVEVHDLGITFHLIATGSPSGVTAETSFTDTTNIDTATVTIDESTCTTSTASFTRGQTVCARVNVTAVSGGGGTGNFFIIWFNPSNIAVQTTTETVPTTVPTPFTDTLVTTVASPTGVWTVKVCKTTGCSGGNLVTSATFSLIDHFHVTNTAGANIPTQSAGVAFNIKVAAHDSAHAVLTGFTGTVDITSTGTLSSGSGTTAAFVAGVLASHSVTISNTGTFTITATNNLTTGTSNSFLVNDTAPPVVTLTIPAPNGLSGYFVTSPVSVGVSATDATSNVSSFTCTDNGSPITPGSLVGSGRLRPAGR